MTVTPGDKHEGETPTNEQLPTLSLEAASKIVAALIGCIYASGLLVTNLYLLRIEVVEFSFAKAQYFFTGGLVLLPLFTAGACWQLLFGQILINAPKPPKVIAMVLAAGLPLALNTRLYWPNPHLTTTGKIVYAAGLWALALATLSFVGGFLAMFFVRVPDLRGLNERWIGAPSAKVLLRVVWTSGFAVFSVVAFGWYLVIFASNVVPYLPHQIGGEKPTRATILVKSSSSSLSRWAVNRNGGPAEIPGDIMAETDTYFVIRTSDGVVLRIQKESVEGVVLSGNK